VIATVPGRCEICDKVGTMSLQSVSLNIAENVRRVGDEITRAARECGRDPGSVQLLAVSKTHPAESVRQAAAAGCTDFAENYPQEAVGKITALAELGLHWHYIGAIQSNKTRVLAEHFHWIHTVSRVKIAQRLSAQCPPGRKLNVTLQVNIDADPRKAGVHADGAAQLLAATAVLPNLCVRGLMTILHPDTVPQTGYERLAALFKRLAPDAPTPWDTLSMGMSGDFPAAIAAGATHVRIGTAIFGPRKTHDNPQETS
jgi:PLP dependent protein